MLEDGISSMGETHRSYDKYGKRMWVATPKRDTSGKEKTLAAPSAVRSAVASDQTRTDVGM